MKKIAIIGAGGFTGAEMLQLLGKHPKAEVVLATSSLYANQSIAQVFPKHDIKKYQTLKFSDHPKSVAEAPECDIYFIATPDGVAMHWVPDVIESGKIVIDISGAFRVNENSYQEYYNKEHPQKKYLDQAVYGLSEFNREKIRFAQLISNPGCYATSVLLPLVAVAGLDFINSETLIIDSKSGTSGAGGRNEKDSLGYSTVYENFRAYKLENHQHLPEIYETGSEILSNKIKGIRFTPQLLPLFRGIFNNTYFTGVQLSENELVQIKNSFKQISIKEKFIRYYENPNDIKLSNVQQTNYCDISYYYDGKAQVLQVVSAIDNIMKGAAGQALQNFNIRFGFEETMGLD